MKRIHYKPTEPERRLAKSKQEGAVSGSRFTRSKKNIGPRQNSSQKAQKVKVKPKFKKRLPKWLKRTRNVVLAAAIGLPLVAGLAYYLYTIEFWVIQRVEITGGDYSYINSNLESIEAELLGANLFTLDTREVADRLRDNPYVLEVFVEKRLPSQIEIFVTEAVPAWEVITVDERLILGETGKELARVDLPDDYAISEEERLIYYTDQVFKSEILEQRWIGENEEELRELYQSEREAFVAELEAANERARDALSGGESGSEDDSEETPEGEEEIEIVQDLELISEEDFPEFEEFAESEFADTPNNQLKALYAGLRREVQVAVESRWQDLLNRELAVAAELPVLKSLPRQEDLPGLSELINSGQITEITEILSARGQVRNLVIISPVSLEATAELPGVGSASNQEVQLLLPLQGDPQQVEIQLTALLNQLSGEAKLEIRRIDLTGEKIIVRYN